MAVTDGCRWPLPIRGDATASRFAARRRTLCDGIGAAVVTAPSRILWVTILTRPGNIRATGTIRRMDGPQGSIKAFAGSDRALHCLHWGSLSEGF